MQTADRHGTLCGDAHPFLATPRPLETSACGLGQLRWGSVLLGPIQLAGLLACPGARLSRGQTSPRQSGSTWALTPGSLAVEHAVAMPVYSSPRLGSGHGSPNQLRMASVKFIATTLASMTIGRAFARALTIDERLG